uniref:Uncharacterized protein n=1 Tax=Arundo donax TaxID=35708 RepID=A0A0A9SVU9_ARUDO
MKIFRQTDSDMWMHKIIPYVPSDTLVTWQPTYISKVQE